MREGGKEGVSETDLLKRAQVGLAVEAADSFLAREPLLPLRLMVELRGLWVEDDFARYLPDDRMRVEPPAPWWVKTGGLGRGGERERGGERGREREGEGVYLKVEGDNSPKLCK